jgi:cystathionine beta-synthase
MSSRSRIIDNALGAVGETPLVRLDKIAKQEGLQCNLRMSTKTLFEDCLCIAYRVIVGKLEYTSAGGSVKDRIAKRMVEMAEDEGKLVPGKSVVIEPTSGNTGKRNAFSVPLGVGC